MIRFKCYGYRGVRESDGIIFVSEFDFKMDDVLNKIQENIMEDEKYGLKLHYETYIKYLDFSNYDAYLDDLIESNGLIKDVDYFEV